jgi:hypothetical protein
MFENSEALEEVRRELHARYKPEGPTQTSLVNTMATAIWTLRCVNRHHRELMENATASAAFGPVARSLGDFSEYRQMQVWAYNRALQSLRRCQADMDRRRRKRQRKLASYSA